MDSHFASPERAKKGEIEQQVSYVTGHPVVDSMMEVVIGLFAVLNEHRQIVALNETFFKKLDVGDVDKVLGLRLGESIKCVHSARHPGGCGTSEFCSSCNAAIAIVSSLTENRVVSKTCSVQVKKGEATDDLFLRVSAYPIVIEDSRFLLLFLQDITYQQKWASLERAFFHDINNIVLSLLGTTELISFSEEEAHNDYIQKMQKLTLRLAKEVSLQHCLSKDELSAYQPILHPVLPDRLLLELKDNLSNHPSSTGKQIHIADEHPEQWITTDYSLLMRILTNMTVNALEASKDGEEVRIWTDFAEKAVTFHVWNRQVIPEKLQKRIFQKNFSTKEMEGRGIGTYIMKLFGEKYLNGKVSFNSSEEEGTVFSLTLGT